MSEEHSTEIWRTVPGWPAYEVSNLGRVRSFWKRQGTRKNLKMVIGDKPKLLKIAMLPERWHVTIGNGNGTLQKTIGVASLVLMAFVRLPLPGEQACHTHDPNPANCRLENLRWGTQSENQHDIVRHRGKHHMAKITPAEVAEIRQEIESGKPQKDIAEERGLSRALITLIKQRKIHKDV